VAALAGWLAAEAAQQLHSGPRRLVRCDQPEKPVLIAAWNARYVRGQRVRIILDLGQRAAYQGARWSVRSWS